MPVSYKNYMNFDLGKSGTSYLSEEQGGYAEWSMCLLLLVIIV